MISMTHPFVICQRRSESLNAFASTSYSDNSAAPVESVWTPIPLICAEALSTFLLSDCDASHLLDQAEEGGLKIPQPWRFSAHADVLPRGHGSQSAVVFPCSEVQSREQRRRLQGEVSLYRGENQLSSGRALHEGPRCGKRWLVQGSGALPCETRKLRTARLVARIFTVMRIVRPASVAATTRWRNMAHPLKWMVPCAFSRDAISQCLGRQGPTPCRAREVAPKVKNSLVKVHSVSTFDEQSSRPPTRNPFASNLRHDVH